MALSPEYGQVAFTLQGASVASFNPLASSLATAYGTPIALEYVQMLEVNPEADTDEIMTQGMTTEGLAVVKKATGKMTFAALNVAAYTPLFGITPTSTGSTPNRIKTVKWTAGKRGNPYFGLVGKLYGLSTSDLHLGFYKCQMLNHPTIKVEQNKFILPEVEVLMMVYDVTTAAYFKQETHETEANLPSDFGTWFAA